MRQYCCNKQGTVAYKRDIQGGTGKYPYFQCDLVKIVGGGGASSNNAVPMEISVKVTIVTNTAWSNK